jgi:hypothetical protein
MERNKRGGSTMKKTLKSFLSICLVICMLVTMATPMNVSAAAKTAKNAKTLTITAKSVKNGKVTVKKGTYSKIVIAKGAAGAKVNLKNVTVKTVEVNGSKKAAQTTVNLSGKTNVTKLVAKTKTNVTTDSKKSSVDTVSVQTAGTVKLNASVATVNVAASVQNATVKVNADAGKINVNGQNGTVTVKKGVSVDQLISKAEGTTVSGNGTVEKVNVKADNVSIDVTTAKVVTAANVSGTVVNGIDIPASSTAQISVEVNGNETVTDYVITNKVTNETTEGTKTVTVSEDGVETSTTTETVTDVSGEVLKQVEITVDEAGQTTTTTTDKEGNVSVIVVDKGGNEVPPEQMTPDTPDTPNAPDDSTNAPDDSTNAPDDSTNAPDDSTNAPDDSTNTPDDSTSIPNSGSSYVSVTGVSLDKQTIGLKVGDNTQKLTATAAPGNATNKGVTYTSDDHTVATVAADGTVTAVGMGTATITAASQSDSTKTATCTVTVIPSVTIATVIHNEDASGDTTLDPSKANQDASSVEQVLTDDGTTATVSADITELNSFESSNASQGTHKWIGLLVNVGKEVKDNLYYGSADDNVEQITEADDQAGENGFILWIKADEIVSTPITRYMKYGKDGSTIALTVQFDTSALETAIKNVVSGAKDYEYENAVDYLAISNLAVNGTEVSATFTKENSLTGIKAIYDAKSGSIENGKINGKDAVEYAIDSYVMNTFARYLGAIYRSDNDATVQTIKYNNVEYTWNTESARAGSNWEHEGTTLVSEVVNNCSDKAIRNVTFTLVDENGVSVDVTFKADIDTTLTKANIEEDLNTSLVSALESAKSYSYDAASDWMDISGLTIEGTTVTADFTNNETVKAGIQRIYDAKSGSIDAEGKINGKDAVEYAIDSYVMNTFARYIGALYRFDEGATVKAVRFGEEKTSYTWNTTPSNLAGSNWRDANENTLVSAVVASDANRAIQTVTLDLVDAKGCTVTVKFEAISVPTKDNVGITTVVEE